MKLDHNITRLFVMIFLLICIVNFAVNLTAKNLNHAIIWVLIFFTVGIIANFFLFHY
jgi:hypothetical protein